MDWKLEKAVQEKIRDFQNKQKQKQRMTAKAYLRKNTLRPFTNGDFSQTFNGQWVVSPRGIGCYLVPGFTPLMAQFFHNNINSKEVCRVFVLRCSSASNLTCLVSFHRVTCNALVAILLFLVVGHVLFEFINDYVNMWCVYLFIIIYVK